MPTEQLVVSINEKGALVVKRNLEGVGRSSATAAKGVHLLKGALAALGVASAAMIAVQGIKLLANFSQEMSTVKAITNATESDFKDLRDTAKLLGETTRYTATQAAQGMVHLSRAGFTAKETIAAVGSTLQLAQAGALDLATAARFTTQVLRGFNLEVDQAGHVADVLAKAANSANTDVVQLGEGLKFIAPIARGLNVGLEETVSVLQSLADAGLQSTLGGTGMRMMLAKLEAPTGRAKQVLKDLALTEDMVSVASHGLTAVLSLLQDRGLTTSQAMQLFGVRAGSAGTIATKVAKSLPAMTKALKESEGYAQRTADIMDDNLNGALLRAKSAIEAVVIELGDLGAESALTEFMNNFAAATRWVAHNMETLDKIVKTAAVTLGVIFARKAVLAAIAGIKSLGAAIAKLWALIMANPFIALAAVIAAVLVLLYQFRNEIDIFGKDFVTLGDLGSSALDEIKKSFGLMKDEGTAAFDEIDDKGESTMANISQFGLSTIQAVLQVIDKVVGSIIGILLGISRVIMVTVEKIKKGTLPSWSELGLAYSEEVLAGMASSNLEDKFLAIVDGATNKALQRQKDAVEKMKAGSPDKGPGTSAPAIPTIATPKETSFAEIIDSLRLENELLGINLRERDALSVILQIEADLKRQLTMAESDLVAKLIFENQQLQVQSDLLEDIRGPQELFNMQKIALKTLLDEGSISLEEYTNKLRELKEATGDLVKGTKLSEAIGASLFDNASAALDEFISGGKVGFKEFAQSIISDIARITARLLLMKAFQSVGIPLPGFQHGGHFQVGGTGGPDSQLVAFHATPGEQVAISTPGQQPQAQAAPVVEPKITIVNDIDPQLTLDAMGTSAGGKVIMNIIQKNRNTIRKVLGG